MALTDGYGVPPAERVVARLRRHARRMFWPSFALIAVSGAATYFGFVFGGWIGALIGTGGLILAVVLFVFPLMGWLTTRYTVTTRRLIVRTGLFVRERRELLHSRAYTVTVRSSWLQSLFRSGTIVVGGADQQIVATLRDVPHVEIVVEALHDLMENGRQLYGVGWPTSSIIGQQAER